MSDSEEEEVALPEVDVDAPIVVYDDLFEEGAEVQRKRGRPSRQDVLKQALYAQSAIQSQLQTAAALKNRDGVRYSGVGTPRYNTLTYSTDDAGGTSTSSGAAWSLQCPFFAVDHEVASSQLQGDEYDADDEDIVFLESLNASGGYSSAGRASLGAPKREQGETLQSPKKGAKTGSASSLGASAKSGKKRPRPADEVEDEEESITVTEGAADVSVDALEHAIELLEKEAFVRVAVARIDMTRRRVLASQLQNRNALQTIASRLTALLDKAGTAIKEAADSKDRELALAASKRKGPRPGVWPGAYGAPADYGAVDAADENPVKTAGALLDSCVRQLVESSSAQASKQRLPSSTKVGGVASSSSGGGGGAYDDIEGDDDDYAAASADPYVRISREMNNAADIAAEGASSSGLLPALSSSAGRSNALSNDSAFQLPALDALFPEADAVSILLAVDFGTLPDRLLPGLSTASSATTLVSSQAKEPSAWSIYPFKSTPAAAAKAPAASSSSSSSSSYALVASPARPRSGTLASSSSSSSSSGASNKTASRRGAPQSPELTKAAASASAAKGTAKKATAAPSAAKRPRKESEADQADSSSGMPVIPTQKLSKGAAVAIYRHWLRKHEQLHMPTGWLLRCFHNLQGDSYIDAPVWALARIVGTGQTAPLPGYLSMQLAVASGGVTATANAMAAAAAAARGKLKDDDADDSDEDDGGKDKKKSASSSSSSASAASASAGGIALGIANGVSSYCHASSLGVPDPTPAALTFDPRCHAVVNACPVDVIRRRQRLEDKAVSALVAAHTTAPSAGPSDIPLPSADEIAAFIPFATKAALLDGGFNPEMGFHPLLLPGHGSAVTSQVPYYSYNTDQISWKSEKGLTSFGGYVANANDPVGFASLPLPAAISGRGLVRDVENNCRALGRTRRLRQHLEKLRVIIDLAKKREKIKKERLKNALVLVQGKVIATVGRKDPQAARRLLYLGASSSSAAGELSGDSDDDEDDEEDEDDDAPSSFGAASAGKGSRKNRKLFQKLATDFANLGATPTAAQTSIFGWMTSASEEHAVNYNSERPFPYVPPASASSQRGQGHGSLSGKKGKKGYGDGGSSSSSSASSAPLVTEAFPTGGSARMNEGSTACCVQ